MNQILITKLNKKKSNLKKFKKILKIQFYFSIFIIFIVLLFIYYNNFILYKQEKYSSQILDKYNITRLYANLSSNETSTSNDNISTNYVMGIIEIPKINVYYPIFSIYNDELLKISPCRFYGPLPGRKGNLCIAGHNYNNNKFFSKISILNVDDEIIIYNNSNKKFSYFVSDIYEVKSDDTSPIFSYDYNLKLLTLITCNNLNNNRIIVRALNK